MSGKVLTPLNKTLVLGLGGTGKRVLVQLKRCLLEEGFRDTTQQPDLRLLCLDFDPAEERTLLENDGTSEITLAPDEICWLDGSYIYTRLENMRQKHNWSFFQEWYPDTEGNIIQMGAHHAGAAQWRPLGRIGFFEHAERIQVVLRQALNRLLEVNLGRLESSAVQGVAVYLVASLGGGTGGGTFLDVAYFLRSLPVESTQVAMFLLPGIYSFYDVKGRLFANTYASLKELAIFANQREGFQARYPNGRRVVAPPLGRAPFDHIYLFDNLLTPNQATTNIQKVSAVMAETIFFDMVESRVGQMDKSASTNQGSLSGAKDDSELAKESVFGTVGTLTLLLPSRREVTGHLSLKYLEKYILPRLEILSRIKKDLTQEKEDETLESEGQEILSTALKRFPALQEQIQHLSRQALEEINWRDDYIREVGRAMANSLMAEPDRRSKLRYVSRWLEQFCAMEGTGVLDLVPTHLPDVTTDPVGPLTRAVQELRKKLRQEAGRRKREAQEGSYLGLDNLYLFLQYQASRLRAEAASHIENLRERVNEKSGSFGQLRQDLDLLLQELERGGVSQNLRERALTHWCWRFLKAVKNSYDLAGPARVNSALAYVLEEFYRRNLVDDTVLQSVIQGRTELQEAIREAVEKFRQERKQRKTLVERSLADEEFWRRMWAHTDRLVEGRYGGVLDFLGFLQQEVRDSDLSESQLRELPLRYARLQVERLLREQESLRELHSFVDPVLRTRLLAGSRHDHMLKNVMLNPQEFRKAYVLAPAYTRRSSRDYGGDLYEALKGAMGNDLDAGHVEVETYDAFNLAEDEPGRIHVRFLSLNHPATNLKEIEHYYYHYARYGKDRKLFHVDVRFVDFPEVIEESLQVVDYVTCGNPGCQEDISDLDRTARFCPHCHRPIRSRCGNPECKEDHLHEHEKMKGEGPPPKTCPVCNGKLRTYWWRCREHNLDIRTTSRYCIQCEREAQEGRRPYNKVSRLEEFRHHILCPGCVHDKVPRPQRIEFLEVYDQVADEDYTRALEVFYDSEQTRHGFCIQCGAQLLPLCPYRGDEERPHFVQRFLGQVESDRGRVKDQKHDGAPRGLFYCTSEQDHIKEKIFECSYCHLPLREGATYCPRCKRHAVADQQGEAVRKSICRALVKARGEVGRPGADHGLEAILEQLSYSELAGLIQQELQRRRVIWFGARPKELLALAHYVVSHGTAGADQGKDDPCREEEDDQAVAPTDPEEERSHEFHRGHSQEQEG